MSKVLRKLPKLQLEYYKGVAAAHWIFSVENRAAGWLDEAFHARFREVMTHMGLRYGCAVPAYCLMPDHLHVMMWGYAEDADLYLAATFLRKHTVHALRPARYQKQAYDHVLNEKEMERGAFEAICFYILENPVRAKLCELSKDYPYSGSLAPGYPDLRVHEEGYWELYWKIIHRLTAAATGS